MTQITNPRTLLVAASVLLAVGAALALVRPGNLADDSGDDSGSIAAPASTSTSAATNTTASTSTTVAIATTTTTSAPTGAAQPLSSGGSGTSGSGGVPGELALTGGEGRTLTAGLLLAGVVIALRSLSRTAETGPNRLPRPDGLTRRHL